MGHTIHQNVNVNTFSKKPMTLSIMYRLEKAKGSTTYCGLAIEEVCNEIRKTFSAKQLEELVEMYKEQTQKINVVYQFILLNPRYYSHLAKGKTTVIGQGVSKGFSKPCIITHDE